jgi:carbon storage regulator CsrA
MNQQFAFGKKGFLLLKRRTGQGLSIGDNIEIEIAKVEGGEVYIAIKAPNKKVLRNEIMKNEPRSETTIST